MRWILTVPPFICIIRISTRCLKNRGRSNGGYPGSHGRLPHGLYRTGKNHSLPCPIFSILDSNRDLSLALLGPNGDMDFVERIETLIASKFLKPSSLPATDSEIRYAYAFCLSGCIGMIKTWLSRTEHESPEAMAELTYHLIDNTTQEYIQNYIR